jgi:hypothetical protein
VSSFNSLFADNSLYSLSAIQTILGISSVNAILSSLIYNPFDLTSTINYSSFSDTDLICFTVILSKDPSPSNFTVLSSSS